MATQGIINLESGIALVLGANIGTCVTASLSAIGRPREAVKVAVIHVVFNLIGVLLIVGFIEPFAHFARLVSPASPELAGSARLAAEVPRQIANAHTIFNVGATLLLTGFAGPLAALVERFVPQPKAAPRGEGQPIFLDSVYLDHPAVALDRVKLELDRLMVITNSMVENALETALSGNTAELNALRDRDAEVDDLHEFIISYLGKLSAQPLVEPLPRLVQEYFGVADYLENVGDTVANGFAALGYKRLERNVKFGSGTGKLLERLSFAAQTHLNQAALAFKEQNLAAAQQVLDSKSEFDRLTTEARNRLTRQVSEGGQQGLDKYRLAIEHTDTIKHVYSISRRISLLLLDAYRDDSSDRNAAVRQF